MTLPTETVHPEIFHYTAQAGLEGILKNQSLWATNYRHLNDSTEIILFKDRLKEILIPTAREVFAAMVFDGKVKAGSFNKYGGFEKALTHDADAFVESCFKTLNHQIYITSFCGTSQDEYVRRNGLLSQWRGYAGQGGFCIEFDTRRLISLLRREAEHFEHLGGHVSGVVYSDDEASLVKEFQNEIPVMEGYLKSSFEAILTKATDDPDPVEAGEFLKAFIGSITRYKHRAFKEESEVRAVWAGVRVSKADLVIARRMGGELKPEKPIKHRGPQPKKIAYVDLLDSEGGPLPINRIIVGPQEEQKVAARKVEKLCKPLRIPVECSDIPYVTR